MISSISELIDWLKYEKKRYYPSKPYNGLFLIDHLVAESYQQIWRYQKMLRITEYVYSKRKNPVFLLLYCVVGRIKNVRGARLGIYIPEYVFDRGLLIDHYGSITINGCCKIGKNCRLHGNNCIGNKGAGRVDEFPIIGDDFDLGFGASVIGRVNLGNGVIVGANSLVTKSFSGDNLVLLGTPASELKQ
ncbi:hypothetical protein [Butyrivibrio sp. VCB2001]|uniref:hypothetical protein n=1 Tax=Butyrivibrio sp. VCB2001 TaxID=1280667 RepID=UPI0006854757|nr:hypothetical protein [Butyrivibrio sp. VCB2001]